MLAIKVGILIDGRGGDPIQNGVVLLEGDRILEVGPVERISVPESAEILDASHRTVMPGLIDSHVHITINSWALEDRLFTPQAVAYYQAAKNLSLGGRRARMTGYKRYYRNQALCDRGLPAQDELDDLIGVDGHDEIALYLAPVGKV